MAVSRKERIVTKKENVTDEESFLNMLHTLVGSKTATSLGIVLMAGSAGRSYGTHCCREIECVGLTDAESYLEKSS